VLDGDPSLLNFRRMFIMVIAILLEHCITHSRYWFVQVQVQVSVFYAFYFFKKFNCTQSVPLCTVAPQAPIAEVGVAN